MNNESIDNRLKKLQAEHPPWYNGSPVAPLSHCQEQDKHNPFDAPKHQVDVFRRTERGNSLFEFLELKEDEADFTQLLMQMAFV